MRPTSNTIIFSHNGVVVRTVTLTGPTPNPNHRPLVSYLRELRDKLGTDVTWESVRGYE